MDADDYIRVHHFNFDSNLFLRLAVFRILRKLAYKQRWCNWISLYHRSACLAVYRNQLTGRCAAIRKIDEIKFKQGKRNRRNTIFDCDLDIACLDVPKHRYCCDAR